MPFLLPGSTQEKAEKQAPQTPSSVAQACLLYAAHSDSAGKEHKASRRTALEERQEKCPLLCGGDSEAHRDPECLALCSKEVRVEMQGRRKWSLLAGWPSMFRLEPEVIGCL